MGAKKKTMGAKEPDPKALRDALAEQTAELAAYLSRYARKDASSRLLLVCDHLIAIQQILDPRLRIIHGV